MNNAAQQLGYDTLFHDNMPMMFGVLLKNLLHNKNVVYDLDFANGHGFQDYLTLPLTNQNVYVPSDFCKALHAALDLAPAENQQLSPNEPKLLKLIQVLQ